MRTNTIVLALLTACAAACSSGAVIEPAGGGTGGGGTGGGGSGLTTGAGGTSVVSVTGGGGSSGGGGARGGAGGASSATDAGMAGAGGRDAGAMDAGSAGGAAGLGGPSLCAPGKYVICEDFEATAVGGVPVGWTRHGNAVVAADAAARGVHALKISAALTSERRIYADATALGSGHWGRVFYKVQLPAPVPAANAVIHSTIVAFQGVGPTRGNAEYRVVDTVENAQGMHQFLWNVQPSGAEFGKGGPYTQRYDGNWHCAEWHVDGPTQSYHFYLDGVEVTQIAINNGAGNLNGTDIPNVFSQVHVGWNNYQSTTPSPGFVAWIDEVAMDPNRIGCGN